MPKTLKTKLRLQINNRGLQYNIIDKISIIKQQIQMDQESQEYQSSSAYSSEDEDAYLLTDKVEEKILETVAKLKAQHPSIYKVSQPIFQDHDFQNTQAKKAHKDKKYTYKDLVLKQEDQQQELPHALQQKKAKSLFKKAIQSHKEKSENDLFTIKGKLAKQQQNKDKYQQLTQRFNPESTQLIKRVWQDDSKMDDTDLFLKQYILNKKWLTTKYKKELGDHQRQFQKIDEEDEQRSLEIDQYEAKYNFRFQEPQADKIVQYPRKIQDSFRIKPESRKEKRKKLQQRKRQQQIRLKADAERKKQQLKQSIIKKMQNNDQSAQLQIQNDWFFCDDCAKAFQEGQTNYKCNQCQDFMLCQQCHDLIIHKHQLIKDKIPKGFGAPPKQIGDVLLEGLKNCRDCRRKLPENLKRYEYKDRSFIVQTLCEKCYDESNLQTKKKFKQIKIQKQNIQQLLQKDPQKIKQLTNSKEIEQMVDQYIKNDFQDVIGGGLRTKFKYVKVRPQSYGLSDQQILFGDDKQMNNYVSIKKLAAYRQGNLKLRNSIYNKKIKSIQKTVKQNKKLIQRKAEGRVKKIRTIQKIKERSSALKKKRQQKLRILNISDPRKQKNIFIPQSRLASYGLKNDNN